MKVVLLTDVKNMGRAGSVVEVAAGHALNMLIPRKQAILATPAAIENAKGVAERSATQHQVQEALIAERLSALAETPTVIRKKANEQGHLYDAVDAKDIASATELPLDAIRLEKPIKELGAFSIPVAHGESFGAVLLHIEAE